MRKRGNIMLTSIAGLSGGNPVYGNFDKESATISFFDSQLIGNLDASTALYFMNANSYDDVSFDIVSDKSFTDLPKCSESMSTAAANGMKSIPA